MFTIIAGVIGLGIAVALLIVGANYLGSAYSNSTAKANATALANFGQQIQGAVQLATVEGANSATLGALTPSYLAAIPQFSFANPVAATTITAGSVTQSRVVEIPLVAGTAATNLCAQVPLIGGGAAANVADFDLLTATSRFACNVAGTSFLYRM